MNIAVVGRGNVGGGLAERWRVADAFSKLSGLEGKLAIDTTNAIGGRPEGLSRSGAATTTRATRPNG